MSNDDWLDVEHRKYVVTLRPRRQELFYCEAINSSVAVAKAEQCNPGWEAVECHYATTEGDELIDDGEG